MSAAQDSPPSTALVAGKYQLLGLIGRGGMGSVWEGRHTTLGTRVAIKFIEAEYANSQDARSRFDNEARAAATIQSKHAIQIFDHGVTEDGKPYIVMEMLVGEPLEKRLAVHKRITLQKTAEIILQVSRALGRAHEKGIIHRDLKPENIFLVTDDEDDGMGGEKAEIAKVLDFGIAKIKGNPGEMGVSSSTKTGAVLGTPFYMSPEQARGLRTIDHRTDIWSLGVIAFKCVTGKLPFDGESVGDLLVKICTSPIPIPSQVAPGLPPAFDIWFSRVMEREPERRFGSVQEMAQGLAHAAGISMRQAISGGGPPMNAPMPGSYAPNGMPGGMNTPQPGNMGAMGTNANPGMNAPATYRQTSNPAFNNSAGPALGGTQSPFTTSAHDAVPMKSNKGIVFASIAIAVIVLGGAGTAAFYVKKNKDAQAHATPVSTETTTLPSAGVTQPSAQLAQTDPPKTDSNANATSASASAQAGKPGLATNNGGTAPLANNGLATNGGSSALTNGGTKPLGGKTAPTGKPTGPATGPAQAATTQPATTPTTAVPTSRPVTPPKGKVEESGY